MRKLVLATSIAETSLTLDGVRIVIDSRARAPPALRSRRRADAARHRARQPGGGDAARGAGGAAGAGRRLSAVGGGGDGGPAALRSARDPGGRPLRAAARLRDVGRHRSARRCAGSIRRPPPRSPRRARGSRALGAIDADGRPTAHGRAIAALPLPPRLGHMLRARGAIGWRRRRRRWRCCSRERGLGGNDADLEVRLRRWRQRARASEAREAASGALAPALARRWRAGGRPARRMRRRSPAASRSPSPIASRSGATPRGEDWISVGGRGFRLDPASPLARAEWLAVAETQGVGGAARASSRAAPIERGTGRAAVRRSDRGGAQRRFDPATGGVSARRERRLGAVRLVGRAGRCADPRGDRGGAAGEGVRAHGLALLPWREAARGAARPRRLRRAYGAAADLSDAALLGSPRRLAAAAARRTAAARRCRSPAR